MTRTVFVTGARGKTGREVVTQLSERRDNQDKIAVRGGSSQSSPRDATTVAFDWHDPSTWADAVDGVDAVYLMRPDVPDAPELISRLVALTPAAHIVLLSEQGADTVADGDWVRQVEDAVTLNSAGWTILRPSWFQQVLVDPRYFLDAIRTQRTISLPTGGAPIAWVDTRDIAAVAVRALLEPVPHHGAAYTLTGPDAVTTATIAHAVSSVIGDQVRALDPPLSQALHGFDPWAVDVVGSMFGRVRDGIFATVTDTVEKVTGHDARTIQQFVAENQEHWRVSEAGASDARIGSSG